MTNLTASPMMAPKAPDYDKLSAADKAMIDRAIFPHVVRNQNGQYAFAAPELRLHEGKAPDSQQVEWDIIALRELHAKQLVDGGAAARTALKKEAGDAPGNATTMLNAIIAFNGNECGCSLGGAPVNLPKLIGTPAQQR